jgi:hypothetical protein
MPSTIKEVLNQVVITYRTRSIAHNMQVFKAFGATKLRPVHEAQTAK